MVHPTTVGQQAAPHGTWTTPNHCMTTGCPRWYTQPPSDNRLPQMVHPTTVGQQAAPDSTPNHRRTTGCPRWYMNYTQPLSADHLLHTPPSTLNTHSTSLSTRTVLFVGCLTSQQQASVSQGRTCSDNSMCCHTKIEVVGQTFYLTQSQYTDTRLTSPSTDPITPGAWQGSH